MGQERVIRVQQGSRGCLVPIALAAFLIGALILGDRALDLYEQRCVGAASGGPR